MALSGAAVEHGILDGMTPHERELLAHRAHAMRECRRSDGWAVVQEAIAEHRKNVLRKLEEPRELGLEAVAQMRGVLQTLAWVERLPDEMIGKWDLGQREVASAGRQ